VKIAEGVKLGCGEFVVRYGEFVQFGSRDINGTWYPSAISTAQAGSTPILREPDEVLAGPFTADQVAAWWKAAQDPNAWRKSRL
jgi:hypothetical protein